jgi:glycosyltransferase involved in cell wall biosynthesis
MISIVMTYHNRLKLLMYTLSTIYKTQCVDYEVVIVDDFSDRANSLSKVQSEFPNMKISVVKMADFSKTRDYCNPSIPFNVGFKYAIGEDILIQYPECSHVGDVLTHAVNTLTDDNYLSYHCYGSKPEDLLLLRTGHPITFHDNAFSHHGGCWYNHKDSRPMGFPYVAAIKKKHLDNLGGFDEAYAHGIGYSNEEFIDRVKESGLVIEYVDEPYSIHQFHGTSNSSRYLTPATVDNKELYWKTRINQSKSL